MKTKLFRSWILACSLVLLLAAGCATYQPKAYTPAAAPADKGLVYIYRPSNFVGGGVIYRVMLNGQEIGKLPDKSFVQAQLAPGKNEFRIVKDGWPQTVYGEQAVEVAASRVTYLRFGPDWAMGNPKFKPVDDTQGQLELRDLIWYQPQAK
ncbi:MAG: DUF2846 domain-containing protein [Proteobacteria bacterium]|nr:DUF2846 domain-containing protein [Pseudomonadota bacterium]